MKNMHLLILICILFTACETNKQFTLTGHIDGLKQGDTLFLSTISLPDWKEEAVDTFYANQPTTFIYKKELDHTTFFLLEHAPEDAPKIETCIRGASILAKPGDQIILHGTVQAIGALNKTGGFYSDSIVARLDSMENVYNLELIGIHNNYQKARLSQQPDSIKKYQQAYNLSRRPEQLKALSNYISDEINDNEYASYLYLIKLYEVTASQFEERYEKFDASIQQSYIGQHLHAMLKVIKNIEPGNTPSGFSVKDRNGNTVNLSDYRGKYLLIYHWGLCPGTIWAQPRILKLYEQYHDKGFEVLGFTMNDFFTINDELKTVPNIEPLFNQPWTTVFTDTPGNEFITQDYYFNGVPILMLLSPEGITLARGYNEVYDQVEKTLEENLASILISN